ncbi:putative RPM1-interacting protein 4/NOI4 [Helianthus debilis subsp. tardiflorus]
MAAQVKNAESNNSESETPNNTDASTPKNQTHATREADSFDSPKRVSSTLHQAKGGPRNSNTASPMWERKVSSQGSNGAPSSTPGRSRLRQVTLGDESPDDSTAVPVFGAWDDNDPASAEGYSTIFDKVREEKHGGGGKSPRITSDNSNFYGHRPEAKKGCGCFPWGRK